MRHTARGQRYTPPPPGPTPRHGVAYLLTHPPTHPLTHLWLSSGSSPVSLQLSRPDSPDAWSVVWGGWSLEYSPPGVRASFGAGGRVGFRVRFRVGVRARARARARATIRVRARVRVRAIDGSGLASAAHR